MLILSPISRMFGGLTAVAEGFLSGCGGSPHSGCGRPNAEDDSAGSCGKLLLLLLLLLLLPSTLTSPSLLLLLLIIVVVFSPPPNWKRASRMEKLTESPVYSRPSCKKGRHGSHSTAEHAAKSGDFVFQFFSSDVGLKSK